MENLALVIWVGSMRMMSTEVRDKISANDDMSRMNGLCDSTSPCGNHGLDNSCSIRAVAHDAKEVPL